MSEIRSYTANGSRHAVSQVASSDYAEFLDRLEHDIDVALIAVYRDGKRVALIRCQ